MCVFSEQLSLIMFSCKHELATLVTHRRTLTGEATTMTNLPVFSGSYLCKQRSSTCQISSADACRSPLTKKKIFATTALIRLKPLTTHKKVLQYMVSFLRLGHICNKFFRYVTNIKFISSIFVNVKHHEIIQHCLSHS